MPDLAMKKVLGGIAATIIGGIALFGGTDDDEEG